MSFGGWSSWQVLTLLICIGAVLAIGVKSSKNNKKN